MERTIDGILNEAKNPKVSFRVRVVKPITGVVWNHRMQSIPLGTVLTVFKETETHYYLQNDLKNWSAELSKKYFEVI